MPITLKGTGEVVEGGGNFSCGHCGADGFDSPRQLLAHDDECPYGSFVEESKREVMDG
jgi:hypothetical protein